jgi:hypothetical protein
MPCESSEARRGDIIRVSGQRPEQGPMPSFYEAENVGTRPLPCTVSFCHSHAVGEMICLSARLSLHSGSPVVAFWFACRFACRLCTDEIDSPVRTTVVHGCVACRVTCHVTCRGHSRSWERPMQIITCVRQGISTLLVNLFACQHACRCILVRLSRILLRLWHHLSYRLSRHDTCRMFGGGLQLSILLKSRQPKSAPDSRHPGIGVAL